MTAYRDIDRVLAEVAQLRSTRDAIRMAIGPLSQQGSALEATIDLVHQIDTLRSDLAHAQAERDSLQSAYTDGTASHARDVRERDQLRLQLAERDSHLATLKAVVEAMRGAISAEHFRMNGASVYMEGPQHEHARSKMRCTHPLCLAALDQAQQQQQEVPD